MSCVRALVWVVINDLMSLFICIRQPAWQLICNVFGGLMAESARHFIAGLNFGFAVVNAVAVDAWRRTRFETDRFKAEFFQVFCQFNRWLLVVRSA